MQPRSDIDLSSGPEELQLHRCDLPPTMYVSGCLAYRIASV
jgi:hypothetical protein